MVCILDGLDLYRDDLDGTAICNQRNGAAQGGKIYCEGILALPCPPCINIKTYSTYYAALIRAPKYLWTNLCSDV